MTQTQTTRKTATFNETMNVIDVVKYFMNNRKDMSATILFFMAASDNRNVCDVDGNMDTAFIKKSVTFAGDDLVFRELETKVTTKIWWS